MTFDGSSIDGFSRVQESDVLAIPDPNTFEVLPWGDPKAAEARVFCDIHNLDGTPFEGDPRQVLRRNLDAAHEQGFTFYVAPDIEFFYFAPPEQGQAPVPLDEGGFFDLTTTDVAGIAAQADHPHARDDEHPGRVQLPRGRAQPARDRPAPHRRAHHGRQRDDVPPGREGGRRQAGRARHVHAQAARGRAGQRHAHCTSACSTARTTRSTTTTTRTTCRRWPSSSWPACCATPPRSPPITNQTVNSYKRLVPGFEAPVHISWARNNRSGLIRVPIPKRGNPSATRIEYRSPDPACNPYLAFSVHPRRRPEGHRRGLRAAARGRRQPVRDGRRRAGQARHRHSCRSRSATR